MHLSNVYIYEKYISVRMIHTLRCIATRSILYEDVVERLVGPVGQLVDPHGGDPLLAHGAFRVPAVDHAVIPRPGGGGGREQVCSSDLIM